MDQHGAVGARVRARRGRAARTARRWPSVIGSRDCPPSTRSRVGSTARGPRSAFSQSFWNARPPLYCASSIWRCVCNLASRSRADRAQGVRSCRQARFRRGRRPRSAPPAHCRADPARAGHMLAGSCGFLRFVRGIPDFLHCTDLADRVADLERSNQPEHCPARRLLRLDIRVARQMKMRRAIARPLRRGGRRT